MPRIYTSDSSPLDFCQNDFPTSEDEAFEEYGNQGDGPDGRGNCFGYNAEHPDYEGENYTCEICNCELTAKDN